MDPRQAFGRAASGLQPEEDVGFEDADHGGYQAAWIQTLTSWIQAGNDVNATVATIFPGGIHANCVDPVLWSSCEVHDEEAVRMLVAANADLSLVDSRGIPPLSACCMYEGSASCARLMLEAKAAANQESRTKATPLMVAAHDGNVECVRLLLDAGASVNHQQVDGHSPLHNSCAMGYPECVEVLLAHRADANLRSTDGFTPLVLASQNGHAACLAQVLPVSSANTLNNPTHISKASAIVMACQNGHLRCMLMLLEAGCASDPPTDVTQTRGKAAAVCAMLSSTCMVGHSALLYALLAHGVHPDTGNGEAVKLAVDHGHLECMQLLSSVEASRTVVQNGHEWLASEIAYECGNHAIVEWLHASERWTQLHHLEVLPHKRTRRLLLAGASLHAKRGNPPCTPLQRAALLGGAGMPQALLLLKAAEPWSAGTHSLFPISARRAAVELLLIGTCLRERLVAASAPGGASFCPDIWVQHVMPLVVSRAQCRQQGCYVQITGLKGSPELNGEVGQLEGDAPLSIAEDTRCGVHVAGQAKVLAVRWRNLKCHCARCLTGVANEGVGRPNRSGEHMRAADMVLRVHDESRHDRRHDFARHGGRSQRPNPKPTGFGGQAVAERASDITPVLLSDLMDAGFDDVYT